MKRGEIWTVAGGAARVGKPRPAVIVQDERFDANDSIVVCPLTARSSSSWACPRRGQRRANESRHALKPLQLSRPHRRLVPTREIAVHH